MDKNTGDKGVPGSESGPDLVAARSVFWATVGNFAASLAEELAHLGPEPTPWDVEYAVGVAADSVPLGLKDEVPWTPHKDVTVFLKAIQCLATVQEGTTEIAQLECPIPTWLRGHDLVCAVCKNPFKGSYDQYRRHKAGHNVTCGPKCMYQCRFLKGAKDEVPDAV